jgi:hypothetical protein
MVKSNSAPNSPQLFPDALPPKPLGTKRAGATNAIGQLHGYSVAGVHRRDSAAVNWGAATIGAATTPWGTVGSGFQTGTKKKAS